MTAIEVKVPDIGDYKDVPVIEVHVKPGDRVRRDDPLVTLESDKAAMEIPAPDDGEVRELLVKIGDTVNEGTAIARLDASSKPAGGVDGEGHRIPDDEAGPIARPIATPVVAAAEQPSPPTSPGGRRGALPLDVDFGGVLAGPAVRRLARELEIDLKTLRGTGPKGRITKEDVKQAVARQSAGGGGAIPEIPAQDFARWGDIETVALSRLRKLGGPHLHRAWLNIPHVTQHDEADITDLEDYRRTLDADVKDKGFRVTLLAFAMKASVVALKEFPEFNASLSPGKEDLILKRYYNIGIAVDTPDGLVVPVIKDVDRKGLIALSEELGAVSAKMREGKIAPADIQGGSFSISSLGGIGGTGFTPIVNAPEVAILGLSRAAMKPRWDGAAFQPRLMLPLSLSYDHRVIDGAAAARFTRRLAGILEDLRQLAL